MNSPKVGSLGGCLECSTTARRSEKAEALKWGPKGGDACQMPTLCPHSAKRKHPQLVFPPYPPCQPMSLEARCLLSACREEKPEVRETLPLLQLSCSSDPLLVLFPKKDQQSGHLPRICLLGVPFSAPLPSGLAMPGQAIPVNLLPFLLPTSVLCPFAASHGKRHIQDRLRTPAPATAPALPEETR